MKYTIKELKAQGFSKTLIYEILKTIPTVSKQFVKNKRIFDENDVEIFKYYKEFGFKKTVLKFWTRQKDDNTKRVSKQSENSSETVLNNREEELSKIIAQKDSIIKIKDEQAQKYALLKQEEKKEKEEWIKKYDTIQNEKSKWVQKYYEIKTYMVVFLVLFILSSILIVWSFIK